MMQRIQDLSSQGIDTAQVVAFLVFVVLILAAWIARRSLMAVLGALLIGGLVLFAVNNPEWFRDTVEQDLNAPAPTVTAETVDG